MSFALRLAQDLVGVEPGASASVALTVINQGDLLDRYELEVDGIDHEWKAIPVPVFTVEPGVEHSERVFFRPPRASESLAGNYPFVVRVRSLETGETRTAQGVLEVQAFHHVAMEISPKKGHVSPTRKQNSFTITVVNLGNTEHRLQFRASDPEDQCAFEFEHDQISVGPGQQREIELVADPKSTPILSSGRLIGFSVTGRSLDVPTVVATAQAQLEQRSLLSPTSLGVIMLFALLFGFWLWNMPKPPQITLDVSSNSVMRGQPVTVSWRALNATSVHIVGANGEVIYDGSMLTGSRSYEINQSGAITLHADAKGESRRASSEITITVQEPVVAPDPAILSCRPDRNRIRLGESFVLAYSFNAAVTKATLGPTGQELDPLISRLEIRPNTSGRILYEVVATNADGKAAKKQFTVEVVDESDATILDFHAEPTVVNPDEGRVKLMWQVTNAARVELRPSSGDPIQVEAEGSRDMPITAKTTYTLVALDQKGRKTTRNVTVSIQTPNPMPDPVPYEPTPGSTTSGTPGGFPPSTGTSTTGTWTTGGATNGQ
jgi:hypothetical protein